MKDENHTSNYQSRKFVFYKYIFAASKFEYLSPGIMTVTGYSADEINKFGFDTIIKEKWETREIISQTSYNLLSEISSKYLIKTKEGNVKIVCNQSYLELDKEDNKISSFGILFDENACGKIGAEYELTRNNVLLPGDYLDFLVFTVDRDARIRLINNTALRYSSGNPAGQKLEKCFDFENRQLPSQIKDILSGNKDFSRPIEVCISTGDLKKKYIEFSIISVAENNEADRVIFFGIDVTGIKTAAEKDKKISELISLNDSKDKLISQISHDLRSPFNSLLGFSEILTTEYDTLTKQEILEYLQAIHEASNNLFGMTTNLLHFSRFQMGRMEFKPGNLKLLKIINKCLSLLKGNAIKKQINISLNVDKDIEVFADEDMLISIIQNLVSNAVKFTQQAGTVSISVKLCDGNKFAEISVRDSGIGISSENLKKIFEEKFYSTPGTDKEFGTGLGLILIKEFIEKHSGKLKVESAPGKGSTFRFNLPVA